MEILLGLGFLGVIAHCFIKANSLEKDAKVANISFGVKDYLCRDWFSIGLSLIAVFIWLAVFGEVSKKYPLIQDYVRCSFAGMGFMGSYLLQTFFGKGKQYIREVIDVKTDIADAQDELK